MERMKIKCFVLGKKLKKCLLLNTMKNQTVEAFTNCKLYHVKH